MIVGLLLACGAPAPVEVVAHDGWNDSEVASMRSMRLVPTYAPDPSNRWADDPGAAALGESLFYDGGLSPAGIACSNCHDPTRGYADSRPLGKGIGTPARHTPSLVGSLNGPWFYWDGRADSAWAQAVGPIENPVEMGSDRVTVLLRVTDRHREAYEALFGALPEVVDLPAARPGPGPLGEAWAKIPADRQMAVDDAFVNVVKAIAAFERTIVPAPSNFDRYVDAVVQGDPRGGGHLSPEAERGLALFIGPARCSACHRGPWLTDRSFHNLGLPGAFDPGRAAGATEVLASPLNCRGRFSDTTECPELEFLNPTFQDFQAAFKTPSLRNVAATAPYMHDGSLADLPSVLAFYNELPGDAASNHRELTLAPLQLPAGDQAALVAFLASLSSDLPIREE